MSYDPLYNEENFYIVYEPDDYLDTLYQVTITIDNYNARFSADLKSHNATFTTKENTNIIANLRKGASVKVLSEYKGNDSEKRTWLYVEISENAILQNSPIDYDFENQTLRAWISDKYTSKKYLIDY